MKSLRIAMAQMNSVVGDLLGNQEKILSWVDEAHSRQADIIIFPELALTGYPPEDLLLREDFVLENLAALKDLAEKTKGKDMLVVAGYVDRAKETHNGAAVIHDGRLVDTFHKVFLPNYGVFDEDRYFKPGTRYPVYTFRGARIGVNICEDIWHRDGPTLYQSLMGDASVILNINASPFHVGKWSERARMLSSRASESRVFLIYTNAVGGQDELVFDGASMAFDPKGRLLARAALFEEKLAYVDVEPATALEERQGAKKRPDSKPARSMTGKVEVIPVDSSEPRERKDPLLTMDDAPRTKEEEIWGALVTGTRDYVVKNGFQRVLVGLSGGIDSAMVATVAADALGPGKVTCLFMPSRYTSEASRKDAVQLAKDQGLELREVGIDSIFQEYLDRLEPSFSGTGSGITEENIQSRIRGNLLMAFSNKFGHLVLTTGNKSEYSTGYATLYGDMSGGFAVLKDVLKTTVYELARYRNALKPVIPPNILARPPTAELKPDQTDQDTLPPYPELDAILVKYVEKDCSPGEIIAEGHDEETVSRVLRLVDAAEYKRRQAPPGVKITQRSFGRDRRMPMTNLFRKY